MPSILSQLQNGEKIGGIIKLDSLDFQQWLEQTIHNPIALEAESLLGDFKLVQETLFALWYEDRHGLQNLDVTNHRKQTETRYEVLNNFALGNSDADFLMTEALKHAKFLQKSLIEEFSLGSFLFDCSFILDIFNIVFLKSLLLPILSSFFNDISFNSKTQLKSREDFFELGNHLFSSIFLSDDNFAHMFPACPNKVYIDLLKNPDQELLSTENALDDLKKTTRLRIGGSSLSSS